MVVRRFLGNVCLRGIRAGHARMLGAGVLGLAVVLLLSLSPAAAQTITGTIRGTVTDPSGAVVSGADVTATNVATNVATHTVSNHDGQYNIQFLPIGRYTITATATGFSTASVGPFSLQIDQIAKIDTKLKVGSASATVNVSAENAPLLQTQNATLGTTISGDTMVNLPNNGLNFQFNTLFVPGAVLPRLSTLGSYDGNERNSDWLGAPSFNGMRGQNNNYVMDGIEINETMNNYSAYNPAPAGIQEMRVITGNADAEFGNVSGGEDLVVTKGGTNQYHGSLYEHFQSNVMAANSWANNFSDLPLTPFTQNQFGGTFGGPIKRNKLFFFGDYLGFRYHTGGEGVATVATAKMRTGDFSELLTNQFGDVQLYNNQKGGGFSNATPYANNKIPIVNPVAKFLFANPSVYPLPNKAPIPGLSDYLNYQGYFKSQTVNNQGDVRVDYAATQKDAVMGRYSYGDAMDFVPKALIGAIMPSSNDYPFQSFVGNWVHTFSPALINEFRAGFSRTVYGQGIPSDPSGVFGMGGNAKVGIPFAGQPYPGFSLVSLPNSWESNVGTSAGVNIFHENNFYYGDDLTWQHGTHTTKFGVQILRYQQNSYYPGNAGAMGYFSYSGGYTENPLANQYGYGLADWVLDESSGAEVGGVAGPTGQRQYRNAAYVQDDWRILPNLTLNLGVRYAYDQPIYEVNNKEANIANSQLVHPNPKAGAETILYAGKNGASRALYNPFKWGFMPRIGFALQVNPRMVFRGAYGTTDDLEGTGSARRLTQNPPFLHQFVNSPPPPNTSSSGGTPLRVENGFSLGSGNITTDTTSLSAFPANFRPALIQQFNLAWQVMLTDQTSAQLGYVGNLSQHLTQPQEFNQWASPATAVLANNDCSGTIAAAAPFCGLVGNYGGMFVTGSNAISNYNAMQATLHHQTSNGTEFTVNYTWSRNMTDSVGFYYVGGVNNYQGAAQDVHNPMGDYGPSGFDTRNALNATAVFPLPFGRGRRFGANVNRLTDEVLGGWQLSGDAVLYSGFPVVMNSGENYYVNSNNAHAIQFRKMRIAHRTTRNWFGTDPTAVPCLAFAPDGNIINNGTCAYGQESETGFGNAQNGSERAPGYRQIDLSAFKTFQLFGSNTLQLRGDAFNAFNMASYGAPDNNLTDSPTGRFGLITSTNSSQRVMQVAMKYSF